MKQTIVVIEDDPDLCTLLAYNLSRAGYDVQTRRRLAGSIETIRSSAPSLIILDVMLPDGDGFDFCRQLQRDPLLAAIPIFFLTARTQEIDRVLGLEIGGDDYITKPFSPRELIARVKARLRRLDAPPEKPLQAVERFIREHGRKPGLDAPPEKPLRAGGLTIDPNSRRAALDGKPLDLTETEFSILLFFCSNPDRAYTREQLLQQIWGDNYQVTPRNIDVHIRRLRKHLGVEPSSPKWIQTLRGYGYRFEIPS